GPREGSTAVPESGSPAARLSWEGTSGGRGGHLLHRHTLRGLGDEERSVRLLAQMEIRVLQRDAAGAGEGDAARERRAPDVLEAVEGQGVLTWPVRVAANEAVSRRVDPQLLCPPVGPERDPEDVVLGIDDERGRRIREPWSTPEQHRHQLIRRERDWKHAGDVLGGRLATHPRAGI